MKNFLNKFKNRNESRKASIDPGGEVFEVPKNRTLLQAANDNNIAFPQHCTVGTCGNCRCKLLSGEVRAMRDFSYTLTQAEINDGYILACQSLLKSDVVIELEADSVAAHPTEAFTGKIVETHKLTHDIVEVRVELDRPISYTAGQFADIRVPGEDDNFSRHRSYSFASAIDTEGTRKPTFHVRKVPGGSYTEWLFEQDRVGESFELLGPQGNFWLRPAEAPILCIAGGSGMAPIKAILEAAVTQGVDRPLTYLFGARTQQDLYCLDEMEELSKQWPNHFQFIPVLSEEPEKSSWTGKRGLVTDFVESGTTGFTLDTCHAYLCGPPVMIDAALVVLEGNGIDVGNIHYDKFLDSRQLDT